MGSMLNPSFPIETERLLLRPYTDADLDDLCAIRSQPDVMRYLYEDVQTREEVAEALARRTRRTSLQHEGDGMVLAAALRTENRVIGDVSLVWVSKEHQQGEIGFIFHLDFQGKGYASEAARVVLRLGFEGLGLHRIIGRCDARNTSSARLMERLGMRQEAHFRQNEWFKGEWGDELVYAMIASEWAAVGSRT
jgi:RimJ/RimL family protein N-acetyltransferase